MILSKSNILLNVTPTATIGASTDDEKNITNPDFSDNYTSSDQQTLELDFGSTIEIDYVAIAGIIIKGNGQGGSSVSLFDGVTLIQTVSLKRDHVIVFNFPPQIFGSLKIKLVNAVANLPPTVSFVSAGSTITVPNGGETSGHARSWLDRSFRNQTTTNRNAAPIANLRKRIPLPGRLNIPNALATFSQGDWQDFLDFASENIFFINEDLLKPESSYCCFELLNATSRAHSETRTLDNLSIRFTVFAGV